MPGDLYNSAAYDLFKCDSRSAASGGSGQRDLPAWLSSPPQSALESRESHQASWPQAPLLETLGTTASALQLVWSAASVRTPQEVLVLGGDGKAPDLGTDKVGHDDMLAEWGVSVDQGAAALPVALVNPLHKFCLVKAYASATVVWIIPLPNGKIVQKEGVAMELSHHCRPDVQLAAGLLDSASRPARA
eukprot:CAMPEP_0117652700 /NCGR_PEP_ID=MMETSP0804-20121206/2775_1 /TAXON_ID=1074897 /ORGANISM="Tetraselmis astigmatica, Strain CCMP880" /LENGTH=188 /DNA_ID=CAMNT_0005458781 /DNA_START=308 /DNA_END=875 /DNA_ORIENTATION=+